MDETVAAIRLYIRHHDPYEDWVNQTRKDAFRTAHKDQSAGLHKLHSSKTLQDHARHSALSSKHAKQTAEVLNILSAYRAQKQQIEEENRRQWAEKEKKLWSQIEAGIKWEETRALEERRVEEEKEAKLRQEQEERWKQEQEEHKRRVEAERAHAEQQQKEKEEEEAKKREEEMAKAALEAKKETEKAEEQERKAMGMTTADEDWRIAQSLLKDLKMGPMKHVKANKSLKSAWSAIRRQITPKIGQLTNDAQSISHISQQLYTLLQPNPPHPQEVYIPSLSSLAKAILLQAETEVTAKKESAIPLAAVAKNLLGMLPHFSEIFFVKLVQRVGGWAIPCSVPSEDVNGIPFDTKGLEKAHGYRFSVEGVRENQSDYIQRVSGIMRVYFHVVVGDHDQPLMKMWQLPRYWAYFARMLSGNVGMQSAVAPEILSTALDVGGIIASRVWGQQWIKILGVLYEGVTTGGLGGTSPEGTAARMRVQLEIERVMAAVTS